MCDRARASQFQSLVRVLPHRHVDCDRPSTPIDSFNPSFGFCRHRHARRRIGAPHESAFQSLVRVLPSSARAPYGHGVPARFQSLVRVLPYRHRQHVPSLALRRTCFNPSFGFCHHRHLHDGSSHASANRFQSLVRVCRHRHRQSTAALPQREQVSIPRSGLAISAPTLPSILVGLPMASTPGTHVVSIPRSGFAIDRHLRPCRASAPWHVSIPRSGLPSSALLARRRSPAAIGVSIPRSGLPSSAPRRCKLARIARRCFNPSFGFAIIGTCIRRCRSCRASEFQSLVRVCHHRHVHAARAALY